MGLIGAAVILSWSWTLVRKAGAVLVDAAPDARLIEDVRAHLEIGSDRVSDLHVWRLGPGHLGVIAAIVSDRPLPPDVYKRRLAGFASLAHLTIEVNACPDHTQVNLKPLRHAAEKSAPWAELRREDADARPITQLVDVIEHVDDVEA